MIRWTKILFEKTLNMPVIAENAIRTAIQAIEKKKQLPSIPKTEKRMLNLRGSHFHVTPEFFVQLTASTRFVLPDAECRLVAGDMLLVPRGVPHQEFCETGAAPFRNLVVMFLGDRLSFHISGATERGKPYMMDCVRYPAPDAPRIAEYFDDAIDAYDKKNAVGEIQSRGLLLAALAGLLDVILDTHPDKSQEHEKIIRCRQQITASLSDPSLNVARIAARIGCSADYLSALFRQETGERLAGYICRKRIQYAQTLLKAGSYNISEIAYACGFSDPGYFARAFRKTCGFSPNEYRTAELATERLTAQPDLSRKR